MESPNTPVHPPANQEINNLPDGSLPESTLEDLDLNPDLYDDDDDNDTPNPGAISSNEPQASTVNGAAMQIDEDVEEAEANSEDEAMVVPFTLAFDQAFELAQLDFQANSNKSEPLSLAQQSRLVNYLDDELLAIQRKFIKSLIEGELPYLMMTLFKDLSRVLELVWFSINSKNKLFGQQNFLIKIMGDLEDYVSKLVVPDTPEVSNEEEAELMEFFLFLQNLDIRISFLFDGYDTTVCATRQKLSMTEVVRLSPNISTLRIIIVDKLEKLKNKLSHSNTNSSRHLLNILDIEIGKLFEGILDRM